MRMKCAATAALVAVLCSIPTANTQSPSGFDYDSMSCSGMTFSWDAGSNIQSYCLQMKYQTNTSYGDCMTVTTTSLEVPTNDLVNIYRYYPTVSISARLSQTTNDGVTSSYSTASSSSKSFYDVPWLNMSAPSYSASSMTVKLSWSAETNTNTLEDGGSKYSVSGYVLDISSDGGVTYSTMTTINSASTSSYSETVPSTNMLYNTAYKVKIYPSNSCGKGRFGSSERSFTSPGDVP